MLAHKLGFTSSWKMLTRDKGWIKPLLVLTIVGCVPILGQIVLLGYALEWARLTAWGVDAAPKQSGVAYGKVLRTGWTALLVAVSMLVVAAIIDALLFQGVYVAAVFPATAGFAADAHNVFFGGTSFVAWVLMLVVNLLLGTFISAATMRATIYDSFKAGWRVDRIFQMIARDIPGFFGVYLVSLIGGIVSWLYSTVVSLLGMTVLLGGAVGLAYLQPSLSNAETSAQAAEFLLRQLGPAPILAIVLAALALAFVGGVIATAMQLVSVNAMGQWFCRFDVGRWGVSGDPLPDGVPLHFHDDEDVAASQAAPVKPAEADAAAVPAEEPSVQPEAAAEPVDVPASAAPVEMPAEVPAPEAPAEPIAPEVSQEAEHVKSDHGPWDEVLHPEGEDAAESAPAPASDAPAEPEDAPAPVEPADADESEQDGSNQ